MQSQTEMERTSRWPKFAELSPENRAKAASLVGKHAGVDFWAELYKIVPDEVAKSREFLLFRKSSEISFSLLEDVLLMSLK